MKPAALSGRDLVAALVVVLVWGVNFVAMKFALRDFTPFQLGAARFVFAALPLALFVKPPRVPWKWVVLYGLFQGVGQFGILFVALSVGMTAALASVLLQTQVFFTALFGFVLLGERAGRPLQAGMVLAALALACVAYNYASPGVGTGSTNGKGWHGGAAEGDRRRHPWRCATTWCIAGCSSARAWQNTVGISGHSDCSLTMFRAPGTAQCHRA